MEAARRIDNPSPPPDFLDFEITRGTREIKYFTHFGVPCKYMGYISESDWITPSGSECSDLSSCESIELEDVTPRNKVKLESPSTSSKTQAPAPKTAVKHEEKNKSKKKKKHKKKHDSPNKRWSGVEYSDSDDSSVEQDIKPKVKSLASSTKPIKVEEPEVERKPLPSVTGAFGEFHCEVCNVSVNSELTFTSHMKGKKHFKELKARSISAVAKQSVALMDAGLATPPDPMPVKPIRRHLSNEISLIQSVVDDYKKGPIPALSYVVEIRTANMRDYNYYCKVCDSQCKANSIMPHLTGYKHYLNSLEKIDPDSFKEFQPRSKKSVEHLIIKKHKAYEAKHGRGLIMVEEETSQPPCPSYDQPGPSWRNDDLKPEIGVESAFQDADSKDLVGLSSLGDLDLSFNDYYCKLCDSHMNNKSMWEAHVRGKRHLKNKKKVPGENASKIKSVIDRNATAHLMSMLQDVYEPVVGLEYIKETQGENGDLYNCFLCGACNSSYDIIDHLIAPKHRIKFLEASDKKGQTNSIADIIAMHDISAYSRESLIENECITHLKQYGPGKISVYKSKDLLTLPLRSRER